MADVASSIAGLIGLAGLVVQSASFLYNLCAKYRRVKSEIEASVQDISRFQDWLKQFSRLRDSVAAASGLEQSVLCTLERHVKACHGDLQAWKAEIEVLESQGRRSPRRIVEKLKKAVDDGYFTDMRVKVASHKEQLELWLGTLNASLGLALNTNQVGIGNSISSLSAAQQVAHAEDTQHFSSLHFQLQQSSDTIQKTMRDELVRASDYQQGMQGLQQQMSHSLHLERETLALLKHLKVSRHWRRPRAAQPSHSTNHHEKLSVTSVPNAASILTLHFMHVVKPGVLITEYRGRLERKLVAIDDPAYNSVSDTEKNVLAHNLCYLRLLVWLFSKDVAVTFLTDAFTRRQLPELVQVGGLTWEFMRRQTFREMQDILHVTHKIEDCWRYLTDLPRVFLLQYAVNNGVDKYMISRIVVSCLIWDSEGSGRIMINEMLSGPRFAVLDFAKTSG